MRLAPILKKSWDALSQAHYLNSDMCQASKAITSCRSEQSDASLYYCGQCYHQQAYPLSCGHRHCPQCQHNATKDWLSRQQQKLLPVNYFMLTFTLPYQMRKTIWQHQRQSYQAMFRIAAQLIKDFAYRDKQLNVVPGFTIVLHTHNRRLDFHPHLHVIVTGGGYCPKRQCWVKKKGKYLFNQTALAKVWRARILDWFNQQNWPVANNIPSTWVVNCKRVGHGLPALKYLARYLYRGVISEKAIVQSDAKTTTFEYKDSKTGKKSQRTLATTEFLYNVLQHVLPKGFHRCRDYGFLNGNQKVLLRRIQLLLGVRLTPMKEKPDPAPCLCPHCNHPMIFVDIFRRRR